MPVIFALYSIFPLARTRPSTISIAIDDVILRVQSQKTPL
nr:MAG TPA: hypothetical protein [Caudoviricetes sp.]